MTLAHFPLNPAYGTGRYRRLLRFSRLPGAVLATVDDTHHAMWLLIRHDGLRISDIAAAISRGPATTCGGAAAGLRALIGEPLASDPQVISAALTTTSNCTHLADLATWAMRSAATNGQGVTTFAITVDDDDGAPYGLEIARDGQPIHSWEATGYAVIAPAALAGMPLMRGFMARARTHFSGDVLEAAIMLQRGVFVARGRRHLVDAGPPVPLKAAADMKNACYSYSGDRLDSAVNHIGYVRDFTAGVMPHPLPPDIKALFKGLEP